MGSSQQRAETTDPLRARELLMIGSGTLGDAHLTVVDAFLGRLLRPKDRESSLKLFWAMSLNWIFTAETIDIVNTNSRTTD
ncbi:MAG: hypothetical protein MK098_12440 [Marinovum sp.]|nr:hypothetical protein [Marinovum sp.]